MSMILTISEKRMLVSASKRALGARFLASVGFVFVEARTVLRRSCSAFSFSVLVAPSRGSLLGFLGSLIQIDSTSPTYLPTWRPRREIVMSVGMSISFLWDSAFAFWLFAS